jgi:hypothetical protein
MPKLVEVRVNPGTACPDRVYAEWLEHGKIGYAICLDMEDHKAIVRWSPERKAKARRLKLERRLRHQAPLFAAEFIARELVEKPDYYSGN